MSGLCIMSNYSDASEDDSSPDEVSLEEEMIQRQLSGISTEDRLSVGDIKRICKKIDSSVFDPVKCSIWKGYVTGGKRADKAKKALKPKKNDKGSYINFFFRNGKVALHRLLFRNFVGSLDSSEFLRFTCKNKGTCCNVNHYEKNSYAKSHAREEPGKKEQTGLIIKTSEEGAIFLDFD